MTRNEGLWLVIGVVWILGGLSCLIATRFYANVAIRILREADYAPGPRAERVIGIAYRIAGVLFVIGGVAILVAQT